MKILITVFMLAASTLQANSAVFEPILEKSFSQNSESFGGYSDIQIFDHGSRFLAISDRASYLEGKISRNDDQSINRIQITKSGPLLTSKGKPLYGRHVDAEGLAIDSQNRIYISFEGNARIMRHRKIEKSGEFIPKHPKFHSLQNNSGLEALAIDRRNWIYAIPERSGDKKRPFPVYRFNGTKWETPFSIPRRGNYLVVEADFGPDGKLYILERDHKLISFSSRIRRFSIDGGKLTNEETLLTTAYGRYDNLEGLSVWRDKKGNIRATAISDDNFKFFQKTQLVEFLLVE